MNRLLLATSMALGFLTASIATASAETIIPKGEICKPDSKHKETCEKCKKDCKCDHKVVKLKDLAIAHASIRTTASKEMPSAAYFSVKNTGKQADTLLKATSPAADKVELHTSTVDAQGIMKMTPLDKVAVSAGQMVSFKPHGMHLMIFGLKNPIKEGDKFPITLHFEKSGTQEMIFTAKNDMGKKADCHGEQKTDKTKNKHESMHHEHAGH